MNYKIIIYIYGIHMGCFDKPHSSFIFLTTVLGFLLLLLN